MSAACLTTNGRFPNSGRQTRSRTLPDPFSFRLAPPSSSAHQKRKRVLLHESESNRGLGWFGSRKVRRAAGASTTASEGGGWRGGDSVARVSDLLATKQFSSSKRRRCSASIVECCLGSMKFLGGIRPANHHTNPVRIVSRGSCANL